MSARMPQTPPPGPSEAVFKTPDPESRSKPKCPPTPRYRQSTSSSRMKDVERRTPLMRAAKQQNRSTIKKRLAKQPKPKSRRTQTDDNTDISDHSETMVQDAADQFGGLSLSVVKETPPTTADKPTVGKARFDSDRQRQLIFLNYQRALRMAFSKEQEQKKLIEYMIERKHAEINKLKGEAVAHMEKIHNAKAITNYGIRTKERIDAKYKELNGELSSLMSWLEKV